MNETLNSIANRSSCRAYKAEDITSELLDAVIKAGLEAPTATNRQELHFTVAKKGNPIIDEIQTEMEQQRGMSKAAHNFCYESPVVVFISAEEAFGWGSVDAGIAVENMAIAAESLGLGTVIIGCIKWAMEGEKKAYFAEKLMFPEGYGFQIALALGYKDTEKAQHTFDAGRQVSCI